MRFVDWFGLIALVMGLGCWQGALAAETFRRVGDDFAQNGPVEQGVEQGVEQDFETIIDPDEPLQPVPPEVGEAVDQAELWQDEAYLDGEWIEYDADPRAGQWLGDHCATCGSSSCSRCGGPDPCYGDLPNWFFSADAVLLHRQRPRLKNLAYDDALTRTITINNQPIEILRYVLTSKSAQFGFEPGSRITFGRIFGRDKLDRIHSLEFRYLGFFEWDTSARVQALERQSGMSPEGVTVENGSLFSAFEGVGGFNGTDEQEIRYGSHMHSFEMNYRLRRSLPPDHLEGAPDGTWTRTPTGGHSPSVYAGLRYLKLDERFSYRSIGLLEVNDEGFTNAGDYSIDTENELLGFQIGADLIDDHVRWSWGLRGNVGVYANWTHQDSRILIDAPPFFVLRDNQFFGASETTASFLGEFGILATYRPQPNMELKASFDMMWIQGLALAPEQLSFVYPPTEPATVGTGGHLYLQGFSLGMEVSW